MENDKQKYLAYEENGELVFHSLAVTSRIPITTLAPSHVIYQRRTIKVAGITYNLTSVAMEGKIIHFIQGDIIFNHTAAVDDNGFITSNDDIVGRPVDDEGEPDEDGELIYLSGDMESEEISYVDLIVDGIMSFEIRDGELIGGGIEFFDHDGYGIELNNVSQGIVCTGDMPITDNPERLLATIMANRGNLDHPSDAFEIENHPDHVGKYRPLNLPVRSRVSNYDLWRKIKS